MIIATDKIRIEGNSLVIRMQPATGLLALTSFVSTEVGVSQDAFFNKTFRYSINGVVFTEWIILTPQAILDIPVASTDTLVIELNYLKVDSAEGESELDVASIEIEAKEKGTDIIAATILHPRWNDSEDDSVFGVDRFLFDVFPSGFRSNDGRFYAIGDQCMFLSTNVNIEDNSGMFQIFNYSGHTSIDVTEKIQGASIRATRMAAVEEQLLPDGLISETYTDYDGNIYQCTKIGSQIWTTSSLKVTHYADGTLIPTNLSDSEWATDTDGACAVYGKNEGAFVPTDELDTEVKMVAAYGRLYNWYAVNNAHGLINTTDGWHVPTDVEFTQLIDYLIATYPDITIDNVGDALKSVRQVNSPYTINDGVKIPLKLNYFDKTVFKEFFDSDSVEVLSWYINVLDKLYQKGIIPNYIDRLNDFEDPSDFIEFWKSITTFFSYFVNYARKFQKFYESETLLSEYIDERGLRVSIENNLTELNHLMINFYQQVANRGTNKIIDKIEEGEVVDGELLRLIWYKPEDEILFNLHKPEHFGWNIGNSSPLYRGLYLSDNANKYGDKSFQPHDITKYSGATLVTDGELKVLSVTSALGSGNDKIKVSNEIDYEFSFLIKKEESALLTVRLEAFNKDLNSISLRSHKDGAIKNDFFTEINLSRDDKYLLVKLFLFNKNKSNFSEDATEIHQGENLTLTEGTVWIAPFIELTGGSALIYGVRFLPTNTSFSHGLIQVNNWISCSLINRNNSLTLREIKEFTKRYLIPYNSHIEIVENNQLSDSGTEEVEDTFSWIGSGQYCERFLWIGDEDTAYCEQISTTTTTTIPATTTTTAAPTTTTTTVSTTTTTTVNIVTIQYRGIYLNDGSHPGGGTLIYIDIDGVQQTISNIYYTSDYIPLQIRNIISVNGVDILS